MILKSFQGKKPKLHPSSFAADNAVLIGDVEIGENASVWYGAVVRADRDKVVIGAGSNVQDNATLHETPGLPVILGKGVTVGHNAVVHGAKIGNDVLIGMHACVLNGAEIGDGSIIAAGALVKENTVVPPRSLVVGVPGRVIREISPEQLEAVRQNAVHYAALAREHKENQP